MYDNTLNLLHRLHRVQNPVATGGPIHELLIEEPTLIEGSPLIEDRLLLAEPRTSYVLPDADAYARRLAEEAEAWLEHARERSRMKDATLVRKALQSLAFTLRHRAHDLAVPSKLTGTSRHQPALWRLVKGQAPLGTPLAVEEVRDAGRDSDRKRPRLVVSHEGDVLGEVQGKHVAWLRPLLAAPFNAGVFLVQVTGQEHDYTLGCNVAFGRVGGALAALNHALGTDIGGDGYGGDGAAGAAAEAVATASPEDAAVEVRPPSSYGGDGAGHPASAPDTATPGANASDVVLFRDIDGTARATVGARPLDHAVRHSPSGLEWGYHGSGPADLARSVLLAFTDEATAERLYQAFKADVIAAVPKAGGVIPAADVRSYVAANADRR